MLKKSSVQFLILTEDIPNIYKKLEQLNPDPIMVNMLVKRVVCKQSKESVYFKFNKENVLHLGLDKEGILLLQVFGGLDKLPHYEGDEINAWIRILEGDIEYIGDTQRCTLTYVIENDDKEKDNLLLKVDNFEDAIHLAEKMGYDQKSYQENLRSKFKCQYNNAAYFVRFDVWAQIPEFTVIEIDSLSGKIDIKNIIDRLNIKNYAGEIIDNQFTKIGEKSNVKTSVDINDLYKKHTGIEASKIPNITIELGLWKNGMKEKVEVNARGIGTEASNR
jgi:hypothetical protein